MALAQAPSPPNTAISPSQAIARAVNNFKPTFDGVQLRHPRHLVQFTPNGLDFSPRNKGPAWRWTLTNINTKVSTETTPIYEAPYTIAYHRGSITEQYIAKAGTVEQQFIISNPLPLNGDDLIIEGAVQSPGTFETRKSGWQWRTPSGAVTLGNVTVFDATGKHLPAQMHADATSTRITINGLALHNATYPVTIDPEIGTNDFRISDMGPDGDVAYDAFSGLDVAYNSTNNEYLVVWDGDDDTGSLINNEFEIFGQRINASTGAEVGTNDFRISDMGSDGSALYKASDPAVVYNSTLGEYFVVWEGTDDAGSLNTVEFEIYGQRITASTGAEVGTNDMRLSDMGPDGDNNYDGTNPDVAYNSTNGEYLVVWGGDDNTSPLVNNETEIFGQRVTASTGAEVGTNDFRISDMGPDGNTGYSGAEVAIAYNSTDGEYLVVWEGDDNTAPLIANEKEIFGQRITASTGAEVGTNDFRISDMGPNSNASFDANTAAVVYNSTSGEYLVVWAGDDDTGSLVVDEGEVYVQRITASTGAEVGTNDIRVSDMGPDGDTSYLTISPTVAWNSSDNEYLVIWIGEDNIAPLVANEFEVFGQRVKADGTETGDNDFRLSDMGPDGDTAYVTGTFPSVAYNSTDKEYLVVWKSDDNSGSVVDGESEIWGQRWQTPQPPTITNISPTSANVGASVTITGTDFDATTTNNTVYFGATKATVTAASSTSLTVTVPTGAVFAPITVQVSGLTAESDKFFLPTFTATLSGIDVSSLAAKADFTTGTSPFYMAIGDIDGDGKADVAATNNGSNTVSILRNTSTSGTVSLATKIDFATGTGPRGVAIGDIDGDGKLDVAVTNSSAATVSIFRNTSTSGSVSFATKIDFATAAGPYSVAIGDIDGDGKLEVVTANQNATSVSVFLNTSSSGTISLATKADFTVGSVPRSVAIGDIDGDGKADVAVTNNNANTMSILRNTSTSGSVSFAAKVDFTTGTTPRGVAVGDIDGDGKLDVAVTNNGANTVSLFRNTSTSGTVSLAGKVDFTTGTGPWYTAIGDIDGDGKAEVAVANGSTTTVSVLRNTATSGTIDANTLATKVDFTTGSAPQSVAIGDIDGDGKPEVTVGNNTATPISVFHNQTFTGSIPTITSFTPTSGNVGATVTITGTNFDTTPANNAIFFGAIKTTPSAATATHLTVTVPAHAPFAPIKVTVNNRTAESDAFFLPTFTATVPGIDAATLSHLRKLGFWPKLDIYEKFMSIKTTCYDGVNARFYW